MRVAIIEDEQVHRELLDMYIRAWGEKCKAVLTIQHFESAEKFLFAWEDMDFDVLFVDIQMAGMNGMELARQIREKDEDITIIFTTGIADYLEEGYEVAAMRYLLKPIAEEKVFACLSQVSEKQKDDNCVIIHTQEETRKIRLKDMNYIEAMGHGSRIGLAYSEIVECKESISELAKELDAGEYQKCHRSYLCRIGNIHQIDKEFIYFDDGSSIPVSRRMYQEINRAFIQYYRRDKG